MSLDAAHRAPALSGAESPPAHRARGLDDRPTADLAVLPLPGGTDHDSSAAADLVVVPRRNPLTWVAVLVTAWALALFVEQLVVNPVWDWPTFAAYFASVSIMSALGVTLELTALGVGVGFALGTVLAAMRLSRNLFLQSVAYGFVWIFRSIPLLVQLIFWFNVGYLYGTVKIGVPFGPAFAQLEVGSLLSAMGAAVLGLGLHQAAYAAEIIRAGILSVDPGQVEAAEALGLPASRRFFRIVLPQAMRTILPNAANEVVGLFKGTSIVSVLAIPELFYQVQVIYGRNARIIPMLMVATVWYVILTTLLSIGQHYVERHFSRGVRRSTAGRTVTGRWARAGRSEPQRQPLPVAELTAARGEAL